jgi:probable HAF family extracellular repeat protein
MNSKTWTRIIALALFAALSIPVQLAAHDKQDHDHKYHHYQIIDLGTFGGTNSGVNIEPLQNVINSNGTVAGGADTSIPTPEPGCYNPFGNPDCFISHAFVSRSNSLKDLGTLPGGNFSFATAINQRGQIAGLSENDQIDPVSGNPEFHAVLWKNDQILDLGTLGGVSSFASTLNNRGQVTGVALNDVPDPYSILGLGSVTTLTQTRGFLWQSGKMDDLGTLGGPDSWAVFVNDRGQVAGTSYTSYIVDPNTGTPPVGVFLWENGKMTDLGNLGGDNGLLGAYSIVNGLNNRGQVVGWMMIAGNQFAHAFRWDEGKLSDLGTLGGTTSVAEGINDAGDVVGVSTLPGDQTNDGFLWRNGVMTDLGTVAGDPCSAALSVNSRGQVVGASESAAGGCNEWTTALLWEDGGPSIDLNSLVSSGSGAHLFAGFWANEGGEIVAGGTPPSCDNGDTCGHAYVLIPCDENHPNIEGCDYSLVDAAAAAARSNSAPMTDGLAAATSTQHLTPSEIVAAWRTRMVRRFHIPGAATPQTGLVSVPSAILSPTSLSFSTQAIGTTSAAQTVTLKNSSTTTLTISRITITGTNAGDFAQTHTCGSSLAAGASCTVSVTFKPTQIGKRTGTLSVTDNAPGSPQTVSLSGTGTDVELSPTSLNFYCLPLGPFRSCVCIKSKTATLTNVGRTTLNISGIAISGPFSQTNACGASVTAGGSCSIGVRWSPSPGTGNDHGSVSISDNGGASPQMLGLIGYKVCSPH